MPETASSIAAIASSDRLVTESVLARLVERVRASGARVVGLLAETENLPERTCGAGILRDIASGRPFSIRLASARTDTSCLLDATGVAGACSQLLDQIATSDLVVLSKFGKLEANGSGLTAAFDAARAAQKPLLTSVSDKHRDAWTVFAPDAAILASEQDALIAWWRASAALLTSH